MTQRLFALTAFLDRADPQDGRLRWLMIGMANRLPTMPWLVIVKVPPWVSSGLSRRPRALRQILGGFAPPPKKVQ